MCRQARGTISKWSVSCFTYCLIMAKTRFCNGVSAGAAFAPRMISPAMALAIAIRSSVGNELMVLSTLSERMMEREEERFAFIVVGLLFCLRCKVSPHVRKFTNTPMLKYVTIYTAAKFLPESLQTVHLQPRLYLSDCGTVSLRCQELWQPKMRKSAVSVPCRQCPS